MRAAIDLSRDAIGGGPSELAYTSLQQMNEAIETYSTRLDALRRWTESLMPHERQAWERRLATIDATVGACERDVGVRA